MQLTRSSSSQLPYTQPSSMVGLIVSLVLTLTSPVMAADGLAFTNTDWLVTPGENFHLTWQGMRQWVSISLWLWSWQEVAEVQLIANKLEGKDSIQWTVPGWLEREWLAPPNTSSSADNKTDSDRYYVLRITESSEDVENTSINYSGRLKLRATQKVESGIDNSPEVVTTRGQEELSNAGKAGIGVGAAVAALSMMGVVGYFFYRRGKRVEASRNGWTKYSTGGASSTDDLEAGSAGTTTAVPSTPEELHADEKPTAELEVVESPVELGVAGAWELPTGEKCIAELDQEVEVMGGTKRDEETTTTANDSINNGEKRTHTDGPTAHKEEGKNAQKVGERGETKESTKG